MWVVVCPERGGKITSLFDVKARREWLVPAPVQPLRALTYGSLWSAYEMCGWDDAFPTLGDCAHPGPGRAADVRLPDHGEVWALPWADETDRADAAVMTSVRGAALRYRLRRKLSVDGPTLRLDYTLDNEGPDPIPFQWAAHPLIGTRPDSEVVTPVPVARGPGSVPRFAPTDAGLGWATVVDRGSGHWLRLAWDPVDVPWFALAVDQGALNPQPNVVPIPATGWGRDVRAACDIGRVRVVAAGATAAWAVTATVGTGGIP